MSRGKHYTPTAVGAAAAAAVDADRISLGEALRIARCSRSTFYRHAEIPRFRVRGRIYTSRVAVEALARRRGIAP